MNFLFHREHTDPDTAFEKHLQRLDARREAEQERKSEMSMMKNYLLKVLERCSENAFGQQAVEHAITTGAIQLTYQLETDVLAIMGEPNTCARCGLASSPDAMKCDDCGADLFARLNPGHYSEFVEAYQEFLRATAPLQKAA